jgi:hypothetical protein
VQYLLLPGNLLPRLVDFAMLNATVESFEQQYQTLNTATNALMANYEEQKRVADLEIAWQNQLTVVTSSLRYLRLFF